MYLTDALCMHACVQIKGVEGKKVLDDEEIPDQYK